MPAWLVPLAIFGALGIPVGLLWLSAWVEVNVLSPRSLIMSAARARHTTPEYSEALVTREFERLIRETQRS